MKFRHVPKSELVHSQSGRNDHTEQGLGGSTPLF